MLQKIRNIFSKKVIKYWMPLPSKPKIMGKLKQKFYKACEDIAKENTYEVRRMTQEQFNEAYEQAMKSCWVFIEKHFSIPLDEPEGE